MSIAEIVHETSLGQHFSRAAAEARAAGCEFFAFNDRLHYTADGSPVLPTGRELPLRHTIASDQAVLSRAVELAEGSMSPDQLESFTALVEYLRGRVASRTYDR